MASGSSEGESRARTVRVCAAIRRDVGLERRPDRRGAEQLEADGADVANRREHQRPARRRPRPRIGGRPGWPRGTIWEGGYRMPVIVRRPSRINPESGNLTFVIGVNM